MYSRIRVRWAVRAYRLTARMFRNNCDITRITIFRPRDEGVRDETVYAVGVLYIARDPRLNRNYNSDPSCQSGTFFADINIWMTDRESSRPSIRTDTENTRPHNISSPYPRYYKASQYFLYVRRRMRRKDRAVAILLRDDSLEIHSFRDNPAFPDRRRTPTFPSPNILAEVATR